MQILEQSIEQPGFKLSTEKFQFDIFQVQFLGHTITGTCLSPNKDKGQKFLNNIKMPKTTKQVRKFFGFFNTSKNLYLI